MGAFLESDNDEKPSPSADPASRIENELRLMREAYASASKERDEQRQRVEKAEAENLHWQSEHTALKMEYGNQAAEVERLKAEVEAWKDVAASCKASQPAPEGLPKALPPIGTKVQDIQSGDDTGEVRTHTPMGRFHAYFDDGDIGVYSPSTEGITWRRVAQPQAQEGTEK
jgi:hypothetical protein